MRNEKLNQFLNIKLNGFQLNKGIKNNAVLIFVNVIYIYLACVLIFSSTSEINFRYLNTDNLRGLIAQLQIILLFYLTLKYSKKGFIFALILNTFSFSSIAAVMYINNTAAFMPGVFAYLTALVVIILIEHYQSEISSQMDELEKEKKKMQYMAYYDNLTEIPNREMLIKRLDYLTSMPDDEMIKFSLIFIDFKNFKRINDSWGYEIGDYILKECAARLQNIINENDLVGRLGGDEFAVIVQRELEDKELKRYIRKIKRDLEKPYKFNNREITLNSNFGISSFPVDGDNSKDIIKSSDIAMYKAKNSLEKEIEFFEKNMEKDVLMNVKLEDSLKKALENDEFHLLFQPQYQTNIREIRGFETLIRWHSPEIGTISPAKFIPAAEESGLIIEIGEWVIRNAVQKFKTIKNQFNKEPVLSINISVVQLTEANFVEKVEEIIQKEGIEGFSLEFEITESLFISDQEYVIDVLYKLKEFGISIAMEDFGTGYDSLSYLRNIS